MNVVKIILPLSLLITTISCKKESKTVTNKSAQPIDVVRNCYNKAVKLKLPLTWENTANTLPVDEDEVIRLTDNDLKVFDGDNQPIHLIGVLPDTSRFFTFLFHYPGDDLLPYLITFDRSGKKIDQHLTGYNCGSDCGFYCIGGIFTLYKDYSFSSKHISYRVECDEQQINMDTTFVTYYVVERKGKLSPKGNFSEGNEKIVEERKLPFNSPENPLRKQD